MGRRGGFRSKGGRGYVSGSSSKSTSSKKSSSSGSGSTSGTIVIKKTSEQAKAEALANQTASVDRRSSSSGGSSSSSQSTTPTQAQIVAADTGKTSMIDLKTGQPVAVKQTTAARMIAKQATGQALTQKELIQAELAFGRRVGTVGSITSRGVSTSSDIGVARATTQIMAQGAVKKQEQIIQRHNVAIAGLEKGVGKARAAQILSQGTFQPSESEFIKPFLGIEKQQEQHLAINTPVFFLQSERERITEQKIKGIESQHKTLQEGDFTPSQQRQLTQNIKKSTQEFFTFTGQKQPKEKFFQKGLRNISESTQAANILIAGRAGIKPPKFVMSTIKKFEDQATRDIRTFQTRRDNLIKEQLTLLPSSKKYKANEKALQKMQDKIRKEQGFQFRREGAREFLTYKPFSAGLALTAGFAIGASLPAAGLVGGVAGSTLKLGLIGGGTFLTGKYISDTAREFGTTKDFKKRQKFLGEKVTEFSLFSAGALGGAKVAKSALQTRTTKIGTKFKGRQVKTEDGFAQQITQQETQLLVKRPFMKQQMLKVSGAGFERITPTGKKTFISKGKSITEVSLGKKTFPKIISETRGKIRVTKEGFDIAKTTKTGKKFSIELTKTIKTQTKGTSKSIIETLKVGKKITQAKTEGIGVGKQFDGLKTSDGLKTTTFFEGGQLIAQGKGVRGSLSKTGSGFSKNLIKTGKSTLSKTRGGISRSGGGVKTKTTQLTMPQETIPATGFSTQTSLAISQAVKTTPILKTVLAPVSITKTKPPKLTQKSSTKTLLQTRTKLIPSLQSTTALNSLVQDTTKTSKLEPLSATQSIFDVGSISKSDTKVAQIVQPVLQPFVPTMTSSVGITQPIIPLTPIVPIIPPLFFGGRSGRLSRNRLTRAKQKRGLTPTATAAVFGIRGKTSKASIASGLGQRFIEEPFKSLKPKTKKKKKKKKILKKKRR